MPNSQSTSASSGACCVHAPQTTRPCIVVSCMLLNACANTSTTSVLSYIVGCSRETCFVAASCFVTPFDAVCFAFCVGKRHCTAADSHFGWSQRGSCGQHVYSGKTSCFQHRQQHTPVSVSLSTWKFTLCFEQLFILLCHVVTPIRTAQASSGVSAQLRLHLFQHGDGKGFLSLRLVTLGRL